MNNIYIAATLKDCGKTSVTLGLMQQMREMGHNPGYIKPVGQQYIEHNGQKLDEDAVLILDGLGFQIDNPKNMSPIAIERGFTKKYINHPDPTRLENKIHNAFHKLNGKHKLNLVEGTGHAGVGSCFGLSNARVAELTDSKVIIVAPGGIGKMLDEVSLSLSLFREHNVEILGVIQNKVRQDKYDKVVETVTKALDNMGIKFLGAVPYYKMLTQYTIEQIAKTFNYEILCGGCAVRNKIDSVVVAAMEPENVLRHIRPRSLIITPGDRMDNILLAISLSKTKTYHDSFCTGGLILTGGLMPHDEILNLLVASEIPVLFTQEETYTVSARMKDLLFKIRPNDTDKIRKTHQMVKEHVDVNYILSKFN
ncbi:Phosphate acetyltransferase [Sedimentisphaera cyanobacteriorum]|uniref:Phosphate acetyltransferase n=1 Tax=Sedimentisphaera cyanobacteriorum TaxID=1940790 RepID=A0A1Q2HNV0_9BACT|nr:AAA family ATPase [Sedimentisphaera cyanobacteriorum]AQQ08916.1 Phosphate acetyltransferase [Sedimentisphaera cyanobacteriorum]